MKRGGVKLYGAAAELWSCKAHEVIISGPSETGKTLAALNKLDGLCWKYPNIQAALVRKTYKSMPGSVLQTFESKVLGAWNPGLNDGQGGFDQSKTPVRKYGGEKPEWYDYPTGSRIWVGGLDNPSRVLSSERDVIFTNQTEELTLDEWETLLTRCTGRAGHMPYPQLIGDGNPSYPQHWIKQRSRTGPLMLLESRHEDNPTLFDPVTGEITPQGRRTLAILDSLTGTRKERLRYGRWSQAEGVVYEDYDERIHLINRIEIPAEWRRIRVIDFGLVHPFVCQWWAADGDGRMYRYREIYMTGRTVATHAKRILELSEGERIEATICDHDAEDRLTLQENGIPNQAATKDVLRGIQAVQNRLKPQADGKPRIFFLRDSLVEVDRELASRRQPVCTEDEFGSYLWNDKSKRDEPIKLNDDGLDATRYAVMYLDSRGVSVPLPEMNSDSRWSGGGQTGSRWRRGGSHWDEL